MVPPDDSCSMFCILTLDDLVSSDVPGGVLILILVSFPSDVIDRIALLLSLAIGVVDVIS